MGVIGVAGVGFKADTVGGICPLVGAGRNRRVLVDDDFRRVGELVLQVGVVPCADGIQGLCVHEQAGNPLGSAGLQQRHGQNIPGCGGRAIEDQVRRQTRRHQNQGDHGEQHQEKPPDDPAEQAAALLLFLLGRSGSPAPLGRNGIIIGHCVSFAHFFSTSGSFCFWGANTQRC